MPSRCVAYGSSAVGELGFRSTGGEQFVSRVKSK